MDRVIEALTAEDVAQACRDFVLVRRGLDPKTPVSVAVSYAIRNGAVAAAAVVLDAAPASRKPGDGT